MMKLSMSPDKENKKTKESKIGEKRVVMAGNMYRQRRIIESNKGKMTNNIQGNSHKVNS